tara:strand:- start:426 stop:782 length:357 start_codon:yes stop_codon:yes gene_type:complete
MVKKVKVTSMEIRVYSEDGSVKHYNYNKAFLNIMLKPAGAFEVTNQNRNVTWYERKAVGAKEPVKEVVDTVDTLIGEGYQFTPLAADKARELNYTEEQIRSVTKADGKVSVFTLKKIK